MMGSAADADPYAAEVQAVLDSVDVEEQVELTALSMLDLCALGAPSQVLFHPAVAKLWLSRSQEARDKMAQDMLASLAERGLLFGSPDSSLAPGVRQYRFHPTLGIIMAARSRPSFVVTCEVEKHPNMREPSFFALGDQNSPVRAIVVEWPRPAPEGRAKALARMGPFGWLSSYALLTRARAASGLAEWAMLPTPKPRIGKPPARTITMFRHNAGHDAIGLRLAVYGDGTHAQLVTQESAGSIDVPSVCERQELADLLNVFFGVWQRGLG
jgi:hypothetical protein